MWVCTRKQWLKAFFSLLVVFSDCRGLCVFERSRRRYPCTIFFFSSRKTNNSREWQFCAYLSICQLILSSPRVAERFDSLFLIRYIYLCIASAASSDKSSRPPLNGLFFLVVAKHQKPNNGVLAPRLLQRITVGKGHHRGY